MEGEEVEGLVHGDGGSASEGLDTIVQTLLKGCLIHRVIGKVS